MTLGPHGLLRVGIIAADEPVAASAVEHADGLMEEQPQPPFRVAPEGTEPRAHLQLVPLRIDHTQWHMHHKYAIFDRVMLLNGSYNWTRGAAENNEENFLVLNHQPLVNRYQEQFELLWEKLAAFAGS